MSRSIAARASAISTRRARARVDRLGVRLRAVGGRVDVGAAGEDQPVEQVEHLRRAARRDAASGGSISASPPARCTAST